MTLKAIGAGTLALAMSDLPADAEEAENGLVFELRDFHTQWIAAKTASEARGRIVEHIESTFL